MLLSTVYLPAVPKLLYDGFEENWVGQPWPLPLADGTAFEARLSRDVQPIEKAASWLGAENFRQLLTDVRVQARDWSGHGNWGYNGCEGLPLYYVRHGQQLWVLAAGESQPARYKIYLHGSWMVRE